MTIHQFRRIFVVVLVNIALLEVLSFGFLQLASRTHGHYFAVPLQHYEQLISTLNDDEIRESADCYDPVLAWDTTPNTAQNLSNIGGEPYTSTIDANGERENTIEFESIRTSTYGDSHTLCDEVNDDETWQVELSKKLGAHVQNFGVGAFGTDQAVLKLERGLQRGRRTPYVIPGIHEENIGRVRNTYRPFYSGTRGAPLAFKLRYVLESDALRLVRPQIDFSTVAGAQKAVRIATENDYWYAQNQAQMAHVALPFTWRAMDLFFIIGERRGIIDHPFKEPLTYCPSCWTPPSPWDRSDADALMNAIVDKYVQLSKEYDFHPILLFFPFIAPVSESGTGYAPPYSPFAHNLKYRYQSNDLTVIDMANRIFDEGAVAIELPRYRVTKGGGHTSAYGNRIIAESVYDSLISSPVFVPDPSS